MSLQLVRQPSSGNFATGIAWSNSPSLLSFVKKGIYTTRGRPAQLLLVVSSSALPTTGQTLILSWTGTVLTFTFSSSNPADPLYLTSWAGGAQLAADLNRNPALSQYFTAKYISDSGGSISILIEALNNGTFYNLAHSGTMTFGGGTAASAGVDDVLNSDYALAMNVEMITNIHTEPTSSGQLTLQASGVLDQANDLMRLDFYDLKEIGRGMVKASIPYNVWDIYLQDFAVAFATIELIEFYAGQQWKAQIDSDGDILEYEQITIVNGGVALLDMPGDFNDELGGGSIIQFLTAQSRDKVIDVNQPEWLSLLLPPANYNVTYTIYYNDGTTNTKTTTFGVQNFNSQMTIPTGWSNAGLGAVDPTRTATYYTVQVFIIIIVAAPISEIMTYILDYRYFRDVQYFLILNSQGGWDTIRTTGPYKVSSKVTVNTSTKALDIKSTPAKGTIEMVVNEEDLTYSMNSGWLMDKDEAEYFRQLLLSTQILRVIMPLVPFAYPVTTKQPYEAQVLVAGSVDIYETTEQKWGVSWKQMRAHQETNYTKIGPSPKVFFDSQVEIWVSGSGSIALTLSYTALNLQCEVNGQLQATVSSVLTLTGTNAYRIVISAHDLTALEIVCGTSGATLTITRISSSTMTTLSISGFDTVYTQYLIERIPSLYSFTLLWINTTDSAFKVDAILMALLQLFQAGYTTLTSIKFASSTPGIVGALAKARLIALGATVTTL